MRADLHVHTRYSDGIYSVHDIAKKAKIKGLDVIAITDHDIIGATKEIKEITDIEVLLGVELSTYHNNINVHMLGYFKNNIVPEGIINILKEYQNERLTRLNKIIINLKKYYNIEITAYDVLSKYSSVITRANIAYIIADKYRITKDEVFDLYLGNNKKGYVPTKKITSIEAIKLLHDNNAIAVIAHPGYSKGLNINDLIPYGLDGIEVYHSLNSEDEKKRYLSIAKKNNLLITGGSDYHDDSHNEKLGNYTIQGNNLKKFLDILKKD